MNSDARTGAGLKVGFNTENTEFSEKGKRDLCGTDGDHREW